MSQHHSSTARLSMWPEPARQAKKKIIGLAGASK
jgi:hypothetical protein